MCLFPMMMGGGNNNEFAPPEAKQQQCNLYILAIVHFAMAITMTITLPPLGVGEFLTASILLCIAYSMNFCGVIIYMVFMF